MYSQLRYEHDKQISLNDEQVNFIEMSGVLGISMFDCWLTHRECKAVSHRGGRQYINTAYLIKTNLGYQKRPHIHCYVCGTGSSKAVNRIIAKKNKKHGRGSWKVRTQSIQTGIPYYYVFNQSINNGFRTIGNPLPYVDSTTLEYMKTGVNKKNSRHLVLKRA